MHITIINGPNLNLLGEREPEIYGSQGFEAYFKELRKQFSKHELEYFQSNSEADIIDLLQQKSESCDGIVLNPAAYSHTSVGIGDAVAAITCPVVEVHISNVYRRQSFRHHSYVSAAAAGVITGFGLDGYRLAIEHLIRVR